MKRFVAVFIVTFVFFSSLSAVDLVPVALLLQRSRAFDLELGRLVFGDLQPLRASNIDICELSLSCLVVATTWIEVAG